MRELRRFGEHVRVIAEADGLWVRTAKGAVHDRQSWPADALGAPRGRTTALEVEQLLEAELGEIQGSDVRVPSESLGAVDALGLDFARAWAPPSPFSVSLERVSDLGRADFEYQVRYLEGTRPVAVERLGAFVHFAARDTTYRLAPETWELIETAERFNRLSPEERKAQAWPTLAQVKGLSSTTGARLDPTLADNDVVIPASLGLDVREGADGSVSLEPVCPGVPDEAFRAAFKRNRAAEPVYSVDLPGGRRARVVLGETQREVVRRMKGAQRLSGDRAQLAKTQPEAFFDGVLDAVDIQYGPRVTGVGHFQFVPMPGRARTDTVLGEMFGEQHDGVEAPSAPPPRIEATDPAGEPVTLEFTSPQEVDDFRNRVLAARDAGEPVVVVKAGQEVRLDNTLFEALDLATDDSPPIPKHAGGYLLIHTDQETVQPEDAAAAAAAAAEAEAELEDFRLPADLTSPEGVKPHQVDGIRWMERCRRLPGRKGVLLADDMGLGKTFQVLAFIARGIEAGLFPDLAAEMPPWRPVLVVVPLILLENETWQQDMKRFFRADGGVFAPVLPLHGSRLSQLRADAGGREVELGRPLLDLDKIQRHRVVITTYETVKNYQHSFACMRDGKSLWSLLVTDEAQEYKTPNTKVSHALKALAPDFHVASTGTPVENSLIDLWNLFDTLQPALLGSAREFGKQFDEPATSPDPAQRTAALTSLQDRLLYRRPSAFLIRREKEGTVGLPPKTEHLVECEMSPLEVRHHQEIVAAVQAPDDGTPVLSALHRLALLYQHPALLDGPAERSAEEWLRGSSKLQAVIAQLEKIRSRGEKAILFARYVYAQQMLADVLGTHFGIPVRIINGETTRGGRGSTNRRRQILDEFRDQPGFGMLVLSPFVAGVGLTIVEANHVFHYGRWWNPAVEAQATDRVYRLGQERPVHVYLPTLVDRSGKLAQSFDQALHHIHVEKRDLARAFLSPAPGESVLAAELFGKLSSASAAPEDAPLTPADLERLREGDFAALVGCLLAREGQVFAPRPGEAPGCTWLLKTRQGTAPIVALPPGRTATPADAEITRAAGDALRAAGSPAALGQLWALEASDGTDKRARELGIALTTDKDLVGRTRGAHIRRQDLWAFAPAIR